jgi:O-antigen/teichoic acid export membrane protein
VTPPAADIFHSTENPSKLIARNVASRYAALIVDAMIGLVMLPFNVTHLGAPAYGLWLLVSSVSIHFSVLDLGFSGAFVKFVAQYRAQRNAQALNEIASTLFVVFAAVGCAAYVVAAAVAFNLESLFRVTPAQAEIGRWLLLIIGVQVAFGFVFSVYGGIVNGFQRFNANAGVAIASSVSVALANVVVLRAGYGLVPLVLVTTAVRVLTYFVYRSNAHRIFPALRISPSLFRRARLREVTGFSLYALLIDLGNRLNYQIDHLVIGSFLGAVSVAVWAPAARIISATQQLTNQLNGVLFPAVVDSDSGARPERLRQILLEGTRLSLATVLPAAVTLLALAGPIIQAWIGARVPEMRGSVPVLQVLAVAVAIRVGAGTATTVLKGAGRHQMLAFVNVATGVANAALSVALVRSFGLLGVAFGTLVPVAFSTLFIIYPAACRRVGLPLGSLVIHAVPAIWPAVVLSVVYGLLPLSPSPSFLAVALQGAMGCFLYFALFAGVAIGRRDLAMYVSAAGHLLRRSRAAGSGSQVPRSGFSVPGSAFQVQGSKVSKP